MRAIVSLAIATGISVTEWLEGDARSVDTALEILAESGKEAKRR